VEPQAGRQYVLHWDSRVRDDHGARAAVSLPHRRIIAIESDGSVLLNTGVMCTLGKERPPNLTVVVMDNGIYENIGGPPTHTSANTDLAKMAEGAGCLNCVTVRGADEFNRRLLRMLGDDQMGYPRSSLGRGISGNGRTAGNGRHRGQVPVSAIH